MANSGGGGAGGNMPPSNPDKSGEQERQRRLIALHDLAQHQQAAQTDSTSAPVPQPTYTSTGSQRRVRWWPVAVAAVLIVGVLAGTLAHLLPASSATSAHSPSSSRLLKIQPEGDGLQCPHDISWSPDGREIAVLGTDGQKVVDTGSAGSTCPSLAPTLITQSSGSAHVPGLINIYDASAGRLLAQIRPDAKVVPTIHVPTAYLSYAQAQDKQFGWTTNLFDVNYTHVLWSHDGQRLAVTFTVFVPSGPPPADPNPENGGQPPSTPGTTLDGVVVFPLHGGTPQVLTTPETSTYTAWNLATGTRLTVPATAGPTGTSSATGSTTSTVLPAASYQWSADGSLVAQPLPASTTPTQSLAPVGNPDGGTSFTLWQPGLLTYTSNEYVWQTDIAAWSPDDRYLIQRLAYNAPLAQDTGSTPSLPIRDTGLSAATVLARQNPFEIITPVVPAGGPSPHSGVFMAWRPDGRVLAVDARTADGSVVLYACASGKQDAILTPYSDNTTTTGFREGDENVLRWSPDGSRLLLLDTQLGTLTIWRVAL